MAGALQEMRVEGTKDNADLLLAVVEHPAFKAGDLHTGFIEEHGVVADLAEVPPPAMAAMSALDFLSPPKEDDPWRAHSGWRLGRMDQPAAWDRAGRVHTASVSAELGGDGLQVTTGSQRLLVRLLGHQNSRFGEARLAAGQRWLSVDGQRVTVVGYGPDWRVVEWQGRSFRFRRPQPLSVDQVAGDAGATELSGRLTAPTPGRVVSIAVSTGQRVGANEPLIVLEAMKMEHVVEAPYAGVVTEVCVGVGDQVANGAALLTLGPAEAPTEIE
jgi:3-methylcrotonyl-CoA carboxylase alpha subunit